MDKENNVLETTDYSSEGYKLRSYNEKTGIFIEYAPEGYMTYVCDSDGNEAYYDSTGKVTGKSRLSTEPYTTVRPPNDYVGFYPNGQVKEKGRKYNDEKIGKWYLYSTSGKLSIWENGTTRKPTKEETANHSQYLQDLINAKAPTQSSAASADAERFMRIGK